MKPKYQINIDGNDVTSRFNDRLLTINIVDYAGGEADKLTIEMDDRDSLLEIPPKGKSLEVFLGYESTGLQSMGTYTIDTVRLQYMPSIMTLSGSSADLSTQSIKEHRNLNYEDKTLGDIANDIAGRNNLKTFIDPSIGSSKFKMLHQIDESDMNFMHRLSREHDGLFKIAGGMLVVSKRGSSLSASGESMGVILTPGLVKPGSVVVTYSDRSKFDSANAYSYDPAKAERAIASAIGPGGSMGSGAGGFFLRHPLLDAEKAKLAAQSRANELHRNEASASAELALGDPSVTASGDMTLQNFRTGIDGIYTITTVEHNFDTAGYTTKIAADNGSGGDEGK